jgi:hypothetical protein
MTLVFKAVSMWVLHQKLVRIRINPGSDVPIYDSSTGAV